jgi:hypothetical protein
MVTRDVLQLTPSDIEDRKLILRSSGRALRDVGEN